MKVPPRSFRSREGSDPPSFVGYAADLKPGRSGVGSLELILGPMFSGKTSRLLAMISSAAASRWLAFKHEADSRYAESAIVSHDGQSTPAIAVSESHEIVERVLREDGPRLVALDEAHFFDEGLPPALASLRALGHAITLTALDRGSWGQPLPVVESLRRVADRLQVLLGICARCGEPATHTQRLTPIPPGRMAGGPEAFEPRCPHCWHPPPEAPR